MDILERKEVMHYPLSKKGSNATYPLSKKGCNANIYVMKGTK